MEFLRSMFAPFLFEDHLFALLGGGTIGWLTGWGLQAGVAWLARRSPPAVPPRPEEEARSWKRLLVVEVLAGIGGFYVGTILLLGGGMAGLEPTGIPWLELEFYGIPMVYLSAAIAAFTVPCVYGFIEQVNGSDYEEEDEEDGEEDGRGGFGEKDAPEAGEVTKG